MGKYGLTSKNRIDIRSAIGT
ncbi:hypothetical protein PITCH_A1190006 [uncultured Desulfobacterium sp.]|uniref:Uncharacterized protein n=1 Tax=uncultured Desulfobacterium sp. TaxID=201089 RepID=A0A445MRN7_9BACT|nr:hypothetical protein PITCH_A1190006 [uncultured Desulfobacterium sp.]